VKQSPARRPGTVFVLLILFLLGHRLFRRRGADPVGIELDTEPLKNWTR
jgi:hypothetical protein